MHIGPEFVGCVASGLVLLTFTTRSMRPLRILAILSNLAFIGYGTLDHIIPVLALHLILLPLNVFRLWQLKPEPGRAQDGFTPAWHGQPLLRISGPGVTVHDIEPLESGRWAVTLDIEGGDIAQLLKLSIEVGGISALGGISGAEGTAPVPRQEPPRGVSPASAPASLEGSGKGAVAEVFQIADPTGARISRLVQGVPIADVVRHRLYLDRLS